MGGAFKRLVDQGHEVHVAYQTSGNIALADDEAHRFANFVCDYNHHFNNESPQAIHLYRQVTDLLKNKKDSDMDTIEVRNIKGLIRKGEARATSCFEGLKDAQIHFMNLPSYETGTIEKKPVGEVDIQLTMDLTEKIKPHQIYAAGDLTDPHETHKVCLDIILKL
jgi:glucosamine-6-phosphate deaminase